MQVEMDVQIKFNLKDHCIETEAKRLLDKKTRVALQEEEIDKDLENEILFIHEFLKTQNFPSLRTKHPKLAGGIQGFALVYKDRNDFVIDIRTE